MADALIRMPTMSPADLAAKAEALIASADPDSVMDGCAADLARSLARDAVRQVRV